MLWCLFMVHTQGCLEGPGSSPKCGQLQSAIWHIFQELTPRGRCPGASCPAAYAGCHTAKALQPWIMKINKGHLLKLWLFSHCEPGCKGISAAFSVGLITKLDSQSSVCRSQSWSFQVEVLGDVWVSLVPDCSPQFPRPWYLAQKKKTPQSSRRLHEDVRNGGLF